MTATMSRDADTLLIAALRGDPGVIGELVEPGRQASFLDAAIRHRVRPLLAWRLRERQELQAWPGAIRESLVASERAEAAIDVYRWAELARLLPVFQTAGIPVLLLKGAALAYSLYPRPWLRPRQDTDLLVLPRDVPGASALLERAGYSPAHAVNGQLVSHQRNYTRSARQGIRHDIDLHWKALNPVPLADLLPAAALLDASVAVSIGGGVEARVARRDHALLLACLHLAAHHPGSRDDLLWLHDVHLLAGVLTADQGRALLETATETGTGPVCAQGLRLAADRFGTFFSPGLLSDLEAPTASSRRMPGVYLQARVRRADLLRADMAAIPRWRGRARLLREHLFPPASYMLAGSGKRSRLWLPALYLRRILRGAAGWFRPL